MASKRIFLSDIHMGINAEGGWLSEMEANECAALLSVISEDPGVNEVILVGDITDDNVCPVGARPPSFEDILDDPINKQLVNILKTIDNKKKLHYVKGNHDIGITENVLKKYFSKIHFHETKYVEKNIIALHGNAYQMWCAPDERSNNRYNPLPPGYFISRMWVTKEIRENAITKTPLASIVSDAVKANRIDPTKKSLLGINVPEVVIKYVVKKTGLSLDDTIKMNEPYKNVKIKDLIDNYKDLEKIWKKKYGMRRFIDYAISCENFVGDVCLEKDKRIVIWGHTHDRILRQPYPLKKFAYVYANCGVWCDQKKRVPNFVETEIDLKKKLHYVRLKKWNIKKQKIESVNELFIRE